VTYYDSLIPIGYEFDPATCHFGHTGNFLTLVVFSHFLQHLSFIILRLSQLLDCHISLLIMPPAISESVPLHPLETYRPSIDYSNFEATVIRPTIRAVRSRAELSAELGSHLSFATSRHSLDTTYQVLLETDYNRPEHSLRLPYPSPKPKMSAAVPLTRTFTVMGYFSPKRPDCFVWESGFFENRSIIALGKSFRKAQVVGVCGVGRNYVMLELKEVGKVLKGQVAVQRMVVSTSPSSISFQLSFRHRLFLYFFKRFLKTFKDFADEEQMKGNEDEFTDSASGGSELFEVPSSSVEISGTYSSGSEEVDREV
jgi:hypothetical protein